MPKPQPRQQYQPSAPEPLCALRFDGSDLAHLRAAVGRAAAAAGLDPSRVPDFVLCAHELAANSVKHADGGGLLRVWTADDRLVCEVSDRGGRAIPVGAGLRPPDLSVGGGAGLWIVRQTCDLVKISNAPGRGSVVRIGMSLPRR